MWLAILERFCNKQTNNIKNVLTTTVPEVSLGFYLNLYTKKKKKKEKRKKKKQAMSCR